MSDKTKKAIRIAALVIFALVMIGLTVLCWPVVKMLSSEEGREKLEFLVRDNIVLGIIVFVLLQVLQQLALYQGAVQHISDKPEPLLISTLTKQTQTLMRYQTRLLLIRAQLCMFQRQLILLTQRKFWGY